MNTRTVAKILNKKMDRKEFLLFAGLALLTVTGVSGVLERITDLDKPKSKKGFGSGPYGA